MTPRAKTIMLAFTLVSVLAAPFAEAARLGGGKSAGMRRSAPTKSYQQPTPMPAPAPQAAPQAQPKKGPGVGTAIAAGAAGAAAGYMLGSAMNSNHASGNASESASGSGFPWGTLALLGLLGIGGLMWFRRKNAASAAPMNTPMPAGNAPVFNSSSQDAARFDPIPKIGSGLGQAPSYGGAAPAMAGGALARLPDGTETPNFLRQAKATFLHLQSLNSPDSLEEVRKYMTPDLFEGLRNDIAGNGDVADFPQLDCQLAEAVEEAGRYIATVRFSGTVSESVNALAVPFSEYWHYIKDGSTGGKWLVAGIQQE
ncbi:Tim44 domain-containing protein [Aquitalea sp. FJL05]|uniref:Tim44 domain-containing protein n=1 Tax=Aquitalea sp. FJL05 TaxID=2153366 RepID=UPI000F594E86|nr:Tim44-like domain-containing protein [Aquitalea sp. FJL05]RQO69174.1 Tim44 domain-containing protein [Aquitalea sp. FJL05]